jgi:CelD/BcsL family acetyltransferase involved in cellulose biosynthesis
MSSIAETATSQRHSSATSAIALSSNARDDTFKASVSPLGESIVRDRQAWLNMPMRAGVQFPSLLYDWHDAWATTTSSAALVGARVVRVVDESGNLLGILPFAISRRSRRPVAVHRLEWPIGDLACPDHLDVPVSSASAATAIVQALHEIRWDILHLESLADDAPGAQRLAFALAEHGCRVEWGPGEMCPYIDLPSSWDSYLASLSPTRRQTIRRKERAFFREHTPRLVDYATDRFEEGWSHLVRLHHQHRQHDSAFGPEASKLQRAFATALGTRGHVWLTTLDVADTPVAAWYGFATGDTMCFYQCGRDPAWEHASVGQVLMGMMIRRAIEQGFRRFDFLRGDEPYKMTWTSTVRCDRVLVAYRRGLRGTFARRSDALVRFGRRTIRAFRSRSAGRAGIRS